MSRRQQSRLNSFMRGYLVILHDFPLFTLNKAVQGLAVEFLIFPAERLLNNLKKRSPY